MNDIQSTISIRRATLDDLPEIQRVLEAAD